MSEVMCHCGLPMEGRGGIMETMVGYHSPPGHNHDDNCRSRTYVCAAGHRRKVSVQNKCPACDWRGQMTCWCHAGEKLLAWPEDINQAPNGAKGKRNDDLI